LRAYQRELPAILAAGARLVAVSPERPDDSLTASEKGELEFDVLWDPGNDVARRYGLVFSLPDDVVASYLERGRDLTVVNAYDAWELPVPGTFVIDRGGTIRLAHVDPDYRTRLEPADVVAALQAR
jgi:peroxiredoxin